MIILKQNNIKCILSLSINTIKWTMRKRETELNPSRILMLLTLILTFISMSGMAQDSSLQQTTPIAQEYNASEVIKSVKIYKLGWELSDPVIELNGGEKLLLSFDDISNTPGNYSYTIAHYDSKWNISSLFLNDYIDGFEVNEIRDYSFSSGTVNSYIHCWLELPNQDVRMKISGNYMVRVFNTYEPEKILFERKFVVYEPIVAITASVHQPSAGIQRYSGQQVDLKVNTSGIRVSDPFSEVSTVICQNHLFQGCRENVKPVHIIGNDIDYTQPDALVFEGGNEFRLFDSKNIRYNGQGIQSIDYSGGEFHIQLNTDESRRRNKYTYYPDLNGRFVVNLERSEQSQTEADYVWAYFTLKTPMELDEGKSLYLFGEFSGWELGQSNRMDYNPERNTYELRLHLKQGAYNYRYLVVDDKTGEVDITQFEGSYFDTENSYSILVYYKPLGGRYDRVVGYQRVSTRQ